MGKKGGRLVFDTKLLSNAALSIHSCNSTQRKVTIILTLFLVLDLPITIILKK